VHLRKSADEGMRVSAEVGLRWEKMEGTGQLPQRRRLGREWREGWEGLRTEKPDCLGATVDLGPRGGLDVTALPHRGPAPLRCPSHLIPATDHREQGPGGLSSRPLQRLSQGADPPVSRPPTSVSGAGSPDAIT
jgi:hypothetical protein